MILKYHLDIARELFITLETTQTETLFHQLQKHIKLGFNHWRMFYDAKINLPIHLQPKYIKKITETYFLDWKRKHFLQDFIAQHEITIIYKNQFTA